MTWLLHGVFLMVFSSYFTACKLIEQSQSKDVQKAYTGTFHAGPESFVPYSNIGLDRAFCAGTTAMHATTINRARFFDANPPSQKCPAQWGTQDDAKYEDAVWTAIRDATLQFDFVGEATLNIFSAKNFNEFGTRGLDSFANHIRSMQNVAGTPTGWERWRNEDIDKTRDFTDLKSIAEIVRKGNIVVVVVHATQENPDESYSNTEDTLKSDCESRGYVWDAYAGKCDWSKQLDPNHPSALSVALSSSQQPNQDRSLIYNHAVLVTGAYDDDSLQVYTTWDQQLMRWGHDLKVDLGTYGWMINPLVTQVIPVLKNQDRSKFRDVLKELNDYYAYTGDKAATGCPGTGGSPIINRVENFGYDPMDISKYNPYGKNKGFDTSGDANANTSEDPFLFQGEVIMKKNLPVLKLSHISGCSDGKISWVISATGYNETDDSGMRTVSRLQSDAGVKEFETQLSGETNRWHITGTCRNKRPYSAIIVSPTASTGTR